MTGRQPRSTLVPYTTLSRSLTPRWRAGFAGSSLAMERQAPAGRAPAAVGAKVMLRFALPPAATVNDPVGVQVIEPGVPVQGETLLTFNRAITRLYTCQLCVFYPCSFFVW